MDTETHESLMFLVLQFYFGATFDSSEMEMVWHLHLTHEY